MDQLLAKGKPVLLKYSVELALITLCILTAVVCMGIYLRSNTAQPEDSVVFEQPTPEKPQEKRIFIDVSGAVLTPDLYEVTDSARLKDAIELAGGLSNEADKQYFARNFNLAKTLSDQEKIYVPTYFEIESGIFTEEKRILDYLVSDSSDRTAGDEAADELQVSINTATLEELDTLPSIGKTTAQKIMENRPYEKIEQLLERKVVNSSTFEKIKDAVSI